MNYMDFDPYLAKERHQHILREGTQPGGGRECSRGQAIRVLGGLAGTALLTAGGAGGIQIEQSFSAREGHGQAIADAVASVYDSKLA